MKLEKIKSQLSKYTLVASIGLASLFIFNADATAAGVTIQGGATVTMTGAPKLEIVGDFQNSGTFVAGSSTVVFSGDISSALDPGASSLFNFTINKASATNANDNVSVTANPLTVTGTSTITDGELVQGTTDFFLNGLTIAAAGKYSNISTGDLTLSGDLTNSGSIVFDANGVGQGGADSILVRSNIPGTQRNWQGTGSFSMTDSDIMDQTVLGGTPESICVLSGTDSGNNINWFCAPLSDVSVTPASLMAGATPNQTITLMTAGILPADGKIEIVYPIGFDLSGVITATSASDINGTLSVAVSGQTLTLTRAGGTPLPAGTFINDLVITGIVNPLVAGVTGNFDIETTTAGGTHIDMGTAPGVPISAGLLTGSTLIPSSTLAATSNNETISFTTANTIPANGQIVIQYPGGFDLSTITSVTSATMDGVLAFSSTGQVLTITRAGGTAQTAALESIVVNGITNPVVTGPTGAFNIFTADNLGDPIDSGSAASITITSVGTLTNVSLTPTNLIVAMTTTDTITFTLANTLPANGKIQIVFPDNFDLSGVVGASSATDIDGALATSVVGHSVIITRAGGTAVGAGSYIDDLVITGVKNPPIAGISGTFDIVTLTNANITIDSGTAPGVPIAATGSLVGVSIVPTSTIISALSNQTVSFTTANAIPVNGKIKIEYPAGFNLNTITGVSSGTIDGVLTVEIIGQILCIERSGGTIQAAGAETLLVTGITNPATPGTTPPINIYTAQSDNTPIDSGTAAGIAYSAAGLTLSSASNQTLIVGTTDQAHPLITITEDAVPSITAANDIRLILPAALTSTWDATILAPTFAGTAAAKVNAAVTYAGGNTILVIDVLVNFAANDTLTIAGLEINTGALAVVGTIDNMELDDDNGGAAANITNDKTLTISAASDFDANYSMAVFNGYLYVGSGKDVGAASSGKVFRTQDGVTWAQVNPSGFGDPNNIAVTKLVAWNGRLLATTRNPVTGTELWMTTDGTTWTQINPDGFGSVNNILSDAAVVFGQVQPENVGGLYFGTQNSVSGAQIYVDPMVSDISMVANKKKATIGDIITYQISIRNSESNDLQNARILNRLPSGFAYMPESTYLDGRKIADPTGMSDKVFNIDFVNVGQTRVLTYQLVVTPGVSTGTKYKNIATADGTILGSTVLFPQVQWEVTIINDPLFDEGTIIGKVFHDKNLNGRQDKGELGFSKVRLVTEEGIIITTDEDGRYHLMGVLPKRHIIKVMTKSLPEGAFLTTGSEELFEVTPGSMAKVNFGVALPEDGKLPGVETSPVRKAYDKMIHNPWVEDAFFINLTEGEIGLNKLGGNKDIPNVNKARYGQTVNHDGRVAYYLDADMVNDFRLVSSLDTDREQQRLFRNFDERHYYQTYGDESEADYAMTETQGKLYARLQRHKSYALWGNYLTDLNDSEILQYNRMLYGFKGKYQTDSLTKFKEPYHKTIAFAAQAKQIPSHDRFRATGGSLYYLQNKNIVEGTERVKVLVEDETTGLPQTPYELTGEDYEINYDEGRIILKFPVQSFIQSNQIVHSDLRQGNPVFIVVDYEYESAVFTDKAISGFSSVQHIGDHIAVGVMDVSEGKSGNNYELRGVTGEIKLNENNIFRAEYGISQSEGINSYISDNGGLTFSRISLGDQSRGNALTLTAENRITDQLTTRAYYKKIGQGFSQTSLIEGRGTLKTGAAAEYQLDASSKITASHDVTTIEEGKTITTTSLPGSRRQATSSIQFDKKFNDKTDMSAAYEATETSDSVNPAEFKSTQDVAAEIKHQVNDKLKVIGRQQLTMKGEENNQTSIGAEAILDELTNISVMNTMGTKGHALQGQLDRKIDDNEVIYLNAGLGGDDPQGITIGEKGSLNQTLTLGRQKKVDAKTTVTQETSVGKSIGDEIKKDVEGKIKGKAHDLLTKITTIDKQVSKNLALRFSYEVADLDQVQGDVQKQAYSLGGTYTGEHLKDEFKMDYRSDGVGASQIAQVYLKNKTEYKWNKDFTAIADLGMAVTKNKETSFAIASFDQASFGVAYRPVDNDRLNVLTKYTYLMDEPLNTSTGILGTDTLNTANHSSMHVFSTDFVYDINSKLQLVEKLGIRLRNESVDPIPNQRSTTSLWVNRLNYNFMPEWGVAGEFRILNQYQTETMKAGGLFEVYHDFQGFARLAVGYNMTDFSDDLTDLDYDVQTIYFRVTGLMSSDFKNRDSKDMSTRAQQESEPKKVDPKLNQLFESAAYNATQGKK